MSWVTVIWSMIASACLTLAVIYWLVWNRNRTAWVHLLSSVAAASTAALACCELWIMRAATPADVLAPMGWMQLALFSWLVSITWFVRFYLGTGRLWLAWTICGLRVVHLLPLLAGQHPNYRAITGLRHIPFLGEPVMVLGGVPNPWMLTGQVAAGLLLIYVADASITAWRQGERRKALVVGGSSEFFLVSAMVTSVPAIWGNLQVPIVLSVLSLGLVAAMAYELIRDLLRASALVEELQVSEAGLRESEARISLAVDAADLGLWSRNMARGEVWASERWRTLFGFSASEPLEFNAILQRLHPDDRDALRQAHSMSVAGVHERRYQTEYRLVLPDGTRRWIASQGVVEHDAAGHPVLVRGASRDITAAKHVEFVLRDLSGRLIAAQEAERARIARDLHDDVSQQLAALSIGLSGLKHRAAAVPNGMELESAALALQQRATTLADSLRNLSHELHPDVIRHVGLAASLTSYCHGLQRPPTLAVTCTAEGDFADIDPAAALCLYRIAQEALHNVVKHARAGQATVRLLRSGDIAELTIGDNGQGFDMHTSGGSAGIGLVSMTERARLMGGSVTIETTVHQGTQVRVRIPLDARTATETVERSERWAASI